MARDIASSIGILIFKPSAYHNREIREIAMSGLKEILKPYLRYPYFSRR